MQLFQILLLAMLSSLAIFMCAPRRAAALRAPPPTPTPGAQARPLVRALQQLVPDAHTDRLRGRADTDDVFSRGAWRLVALVERAAKGA